MGKPRESKSSAHGAIGQWCGNDTYVFILYWQDSANVGTAVWQNVTNSGGSATYLAVAVHV